MVEQGFAIERGGRQIRHAVFGLRWAWEGGLGDSEVVWRADGGLRQWLGRQMGARAGPREMDAYSSAAIKEATYSMLAARRAAGLRLRR